MGFFVWLFFCIGRWRLLRFRGEDREEKRGSESFVPMVGAVLF